VYNFKALDTVGEVNRRYTALLINDTVGDGKRSCWINVWQLTA